MIRILFVVPSLSGGGAERVLLHILKHIDRAKFCPTLVLFKKRGELLFDLPSDIPVKVLNSKWLTIIKLARLLREDVPDIVLSFMWYTNFVTLLSRILSNVPCRVVISERYSISPSFEGRFVEFLRRSVIRLFYLRADKIIVNSRTMGEQLISMFPVLQNRNIVIYNPVDVEGVCLLGREQIDHPWFDEKTPIIMGIGRLTRQKGFDCLIGAVHRLIMEGVECKLIILGAGSEGQRLKKMILDFGLEDKVYLPGFKKNPYKYFLSSTIFVLSSHYEGFPNVLIEALSLGVPSIATRCPTGPEEIITDGENGILVPVGDETALAQAIKTLLREGDIRKKFSEEGKKRIEVFEVKGIMKQYEDVIEKVCAGSAER